MGAVLGAGAALDATSRCAAVAIQTLNCQVQATPFACRDGRCGLRIRIVDTLLRRLLHTDTVHDSSAPSVHAFALSPLSCFVYVNAALFECSTV